MAASCFEALRSSNSKYALVFNRFEVATGNIIQDAYASVAKYIPGTWGITYNKSSNMAGQGKLPMRVGDVFQRAAKLCE